MICPVNKNHDYFMYLTESDVSGKLTRQIRKDVRSRIQHQPVKQGSCSQTEVFPKLMTSNVTMYYIACIDCVTKANRGPTSLMCPKCGNVSKRFRSCKKQRRFKETTRNGKHWERVSERSSDRVSGLVSKKRRAKAKYDVHKREKREPIMTLCYDTIQSREQTRILLGKKDKNKEEPGVFGKGNRGGDIVFVL
ncbi:hypothetical protein YC2023_076066 [Brassica napus]